MGKSVVTLFGGTFDPPHLGHLHLAKYALSHFDMKYLLFCPANQSPAKDKKAPIASGKHRIAMLECMLEGIPKTEVLDFEVKQPTLSYTIDTVRHIQKIYPDNEILFLLSKGTLERFAGWKDVRTLLQIATPLLAISNEMDREALAILPDDIKEILEKNSFNLPPLPIDSRVIRERLAKQLDCTEFVPGKVLDYICKHQLY